MRLLSFLESRDQEFPTQTSVEEFLGDESLQESSTGRRDFLKFLGFSVAAATVAACEAPVTKADSICEQARECYARYAYLVCINLL